jgi:hypothetical protein
MERVEDGDGSLSVILAGHPKLRNDPQIIRARARRQLQSFRAANGVNCKHGQSISSCYTYWTLGALAGTASLAPPAGAADDAPAGAAAPESS